MAGKAIWKWESWYNLEVSALNVVFFFNFNDHRWLIRHFSVICVTFKPQKRQLVSHLGGIRHYKYSNDDEFDSKEYYINEFFESVYESLKLFKDDDLLSKPGKALYSSKHYLSKTNCSPDFKVPNINTQRTVTPWLVRFYSPFWRKIKNLKLI